MLCLPVQQVYAAPEGPAAKTEAEKPPEKNHEKPVPPHEKEHEKPVPLHEKKHPKPHEMKHEKPVPAA